MSGMYYYGYRFYDPNLQRWPNRDPLGDYAFFRQKTRGMSWANKQAMRVEARRNHYMFVWNRPTIAMDPEGLEGWIPYWNPNGDGRPIGVPTVETPCVRAIKETAQMIYLGNNGYEGYPMSNSDDRMQHCITSCNIAKACGGFMAAALGDFKELNDRLRGGSWEESHGDQAANKHGRAGACDKRDCEDYCQDTRNQYPAAGE